jgi:hypothetical protein
MGVFQWAKPWWYPLARDPYGDAAPFWLQLQASVAERLPSCPIKTWEPDPASQAQSRGSMDGARNTWVDPLGATITEHPTMPFDPTADNPIPGAGDLRGFRYRYGVHVTGPCGLHHIMTSYEARALASWLMKMSAEEPT